MSMKIYTPLLKTFLHRPDINFYSCMPLIFIANVLTK